MDEDAIFDAAMSRTTTAKRSRERERSGGDRDRSRDRGRDRRRDSPDERKRSRTRHGDDEQAAPAWKPSGPLEDQAAMFQSAPPSSYGGGRGSGGGGGGGGGGRRGDGPVPEVFSVHHGEVRSIQSYGVFVNMPGFKDGLVHISQLASYRVDDANEVVSQGQRVWVKVIEVDANNKVSLSMKMVNQETGRDEDPDHFEALEAQGRKGGGGQRGPMKFSEETHLGSVNMGAYPRPAPPPRPHYTHHHHHHHHHSGIPFFVCLVICMSMAIVAEECRSGALDKFTRSRKTNGRCKLCLGEKRR